MLKVLLERDLLTEQYVESKGKHSRDAEVNSSAVSAKKLLQERATILESASLNQREHTVMSRVIQTRAEITVSRRVLDVEMIKMSLKMIKNEHAALLSVFEQGGADSKVHVYVHPQQ